MLRHEHWRMSQLSENDASEPVQLDLFDCWRIPYLSQLQRESNSKGRAISARDTNIKFVRAQRADCCYRHYLRPCF